MAKSVGLILKGFKVLVREKNATGTIAAVEKDGFAFFEASAAAVMVCKLMAIPLSPRVAATHEGDYTRKSYWSRKKKDAASAIEMDKVSQDISIHYKRASLSPTKRGKKITFLTGLYNTPPKKGVWLPKTFSFRYPAWLNNSFALDFAAEWFGAKVQPEPKEVTQLHGVVYLGNMPYGIPSKSKVTSDGGTPQDVQDILDKQGSSNPPTTDRR